MKTLAVAVAVVLVVCSCKAPRCDERMRALEAIVAEQRKATSSGPVVVRLADRPHEEGWEERGVHVVADPGLEVAPAQAAAMTRLASKTRVEFCVPRPPAPVARKHSLDADPGEIDALVQKVASVDPADRATVLAGEFGAQRWSCDEVSKEWAAAGHASPGDRLGIVARGMIDAFHDCGCPRRDVERAYAYVTLMADVWDEPMDCAPVTVAASGAALPSTPLPAAGFLAAVRGAPQGFQAPPELP